MTDILMIEGLRKSFPDADKPLLFEDVTASVAEPEAIALVGASGQGKSTLLRILGMLDVPDEGVVCFMGKPSGDWSPLEWRKRIAYVAQQAVMLPGTVGANLQTVSRIHQSPFNDKLAEMLMGQAGLGDVNWDKDAATLSGGQKQRVALVRSMLLEPDILLLDEVTSSLDADSKSQAEAMLTNWRKERGTTLIWVTHDPEQARTCCERIWLMAGHTLQQDMPSAEFFSGSGKGAAEITGESCKGGRK